MEFLLVNHPLDCPICDQAGECDLQVGVVPASPLTFLYLCASVSSSHSNEAKCIVCEYAYVITICTGSVNGSWQ